MQDESLAVCLSSFVALSLRNASQFDSSGYLQLRLTKAMTAFSLIGACNSLASLSAFAAKAVSQIIHTYAYDTYGDWLHAFLCNALHDACIYACLPAMMQMKQLLGIQACRLYLVDSSDPNVFYW
jgi:hypothetical protein